MCIKSHDNGSRHTCCCGCPLICGVIIIAVFEGFSLAGAIQIFDFWNIIVSSILILMFLASFVLRENVMIRRSLFYSYFLSLIFVLFGMIMYCVNNDGTGMVAGVCDKFNIVGSWDDCAEDISDWMNIFYGAWFTVVCLVRGYFVCILYYYQKHASIATEYAVLDGKQGKDHHHDHNHH